MRYGVLLCLLTINCISIAQETGNTSVNNASNNSSNGDYLHISENRIQEKQPYCNKLLNRGCYYNVGVYTGASFVWIPSCIVTTHQVYNILREWGIIRGNGDTRPATRQQVNRLANRITRLERANNVHGDEDDDQQNSLYGDRISNILNGPSGTIITSIVANLLIKGACDAWGSIRVLAAHDDNIIEFAQHYTECFNILTRYRGIGQVMGDKALPSQYVEQLRKDVQRFVDGVEYLLAYLYVVSEYADEELQHDIAQCCYTLRNLTHICVDSLQACMTGNDLYRIADKMKEMLVNELQTYQQYRAQHDSFGILSRRYMKAFKELVF